MAVTSGKCCPNCRYEVPTGQVGVICPECGTEVGTFHEIFAIASSPRWYVRGMVGSMIIIALSSVLNSWPVRRSQPDLWWADWPGIISHLLWKVIPAALWVLASARMLWPPPNARRVKFPGWIVIPAGICLALATPWQFHEDVKLLESYWGISIPLPGVEWGEWQLWVYVVASGGIQAAQLYLASWILERSGLAYASLWILFAAFPLPVLVLLVPETCVIPASLLFASAVFVHGTFRDATRDQGHAAA